MGRTEWIGVDLDGTLAHYEKWGMWNEIGAPIAPMVERIRGWLDERRVVKIFTARVGIENGTCLVTGRPFTKMDVSNVIQDWCHRNVRLNWRPEVTATKDYLMVELWDDRAVQVIPNTGQTVAEEMAAQYFARHGVAWSPK
jgi:hypothetical protein